MRGTITNSRPLQWTDTKFEQALDDAIDWFMPDYQEIKGRTVDVNEENIFLREFFLHKYKMTRKMFWELKNRYPYLEDKIDELKEVQEFKLARLGFFKKADSSMAKFLLINLHDREWSDKKVNENSLEIKDFDIKDLIRFKND